MARPELEFFLLSIAKDHHYPLWFLESPDLGSDVNRHVPPFTRDELIETLSDMFTGGDLLARRHKGEFDRPWFVPARSEIDAALCGALRLEYCLTPQGGARWEAMSEFDWNFDISDFHDDGFASASREMIETYLSWTSLSLSGSKVIPGTERWSVERPWKATYWKELPEGIRVHYEEGPTRKLANWFELIGDLWSREWNERRRDEMRQFIPMTSHRTEGVAEAQESLADLPTLLNAEDAATQYAAALRLSQSGGHTETLIEWFLKRRRRYALRVVSSSHSTQVLDALVEVLKTMTPEGAYDSAFRHQLVQAIGSYGDTATPRLGPLLQTESLDICRDVLAALAETSSPAAGALILGWLETIYPYRGDDCLRVTAALIALGRLRELRALPLLAQLIEREPRWATEPLILFDHPDAWSILKRFIRSEARIDRRALAARRMAAADPTWQGEFDRLQRENDCEHLRALTSFIVTDKYRSEINDPIAALIGVFKNPEPERRVAAITLICRHDQPFPTGEVTAMLNDPIPEVRANAAYALGLRGTATVRPIVESALTDPSGLVRYCARAALRRLG